MVQDSQSWNWRLGLAGFLAVGSAIVLSGNCALAQITPDGTLGAEGSTVTPNVNISGLPGDRIDGGATRGTNLFHSFLDFNVGNGQRVYFANPVGIENILSRVTGNNLSNILGTLGVDGGANLFLLNPNGMIFGENAKLDIAGSFVASTANSVVFNNGYQFSAKNPEAPPLLTVNVPLGVQYGTNQLSTTIANSGNLAVGQDFTLSAGNLDLQRQLQAGRDLTLQAQDTVKVRDSSTSPFIASADGNLLVQGNQGVDIFALNHPESGLFSGGNMVLRSANTVGGDAHYWSGGSFRIEKLDGSLGDLYSPYDPIIRSLGDVSFDIYLGTSLHILAGGEVNVGIVFITDAETGAAGVDYIQETVPLSNRTEVSINGSFQPTLDIRAGVAPAWIGIPGVTGFNPVTDLFLDQEFLTNSPTSANITIGSAMIFPPNGLVFITNQYQPNTALTGGDIKITAGIDASGIGGNGGSVILDSRGNIAITNSDIDSSSDVGNAGDITLLANETVSVNNSFISSTTYGAGEGGDINIQARRLLVTDGAQVTANTRGEGKGGNLIVNASQAVQLMGTSADGQIGSGLLAQTGGTGDGGNIEITTPSLLVTDGAGASVNTFGEGKGGNLIVNAPQAVQVIGTSADGQLGSGLYAQATRGTSRKAGDLTINTGTLLVRDGAQVSASTFGQGDGGNLTVNASKDVQVIGISADDQHSSNVSANANEGASGKAGDLTINTGTLLVRDGARVSTITNGQGDGGKLTVNASQQVQVIGESADGQATSGLFASAQPDASGKAGDLTINTGTLLVRDGAQVSASTFGEGDGGNLTVNASKDVQLIGTSADSHTSSGLFTSARPGASGKAGDLTINSGTLLVQDGARVSTGTWGEGNGGNLTVNASKDVQVIGTSADGELVSGLFASQSELGVSGKAGDLTINTGTLRVRDGAQVSTGTWGEGNGGNLTVNASKDVQLIGTSTDGQASSGLFASAESGSSGKAGDLTINTGILLVEDGAQVGTGTWGEGNGGNLTVNASKDVQLIGTSTDGQASSGLFASALPGSSGKAGDLTINTGILLVEDGADVSASPWGEGDGGNLTVNASQAVLVIGESADGDYPSGLYAEAQPGSSGKAGDMTINTDTLLVGDGAQVGAGTWGEGDGGNLTVNASQAVLVIGESADGRAPSGLFAQSDRGASGKAGDMTINTDTLLVGDGAEVSVRSFQGQAGNITIQANSVFLNRGTLFAETAKSSLEGGANITLKGLDFLRMDNESLISASALGTANGGNVTIDSTLIVATPPTGPEGSDIIANAEQGNGGRVNVTTQGLFGIEFRPQRTPKNDITVSSTFGLSGEYTLNSPGVDPSRGLTQLPTNVVDPTKLIDRRCTPSQSSDRRSSFTITGRGGLPPSPNEPLRNEEVITNWITLPSEEQRPDATTPEKSTNQPLVEAQGWMINEQGQVVLTAETTTVTPQTSWLPSPSCPASQAGTQ